MCGFHETWIAHIMECVQTVTYSISVNGDLIDRFIPTRGICQGDPLFPNLFILCVDVLSTSLRIDSDQKGIWGSRSGVVVL